MKIHVRVRPGAKTEKIEKIDDTHYRISVKDTPINGQANEAVIDALASHLGIKPYLVEITSGHTGRDKIVEITT